MLKMSYKISTACLLGCFLFFLAGCNSWLDLLPENQQTTDMYWKTKEDVEAVVTSGYIRMKSCLEKFVQWGELRGDGIALTSATSNADQQFRIELVYYLPGDRFCQCRHQICAYGADTR